jgi:hypothetical protein
MTINHQFHIAKFLPAVFALLSPSPKASTAGESYAKAMQAASHQHSNIPDLKTSVTCLHLDC